MAIYLVILSALVALYLTKIIGERILLKKAGALSHIERTKASKAFNFVACLLIIVVFIVISTSRAISVGYDTINYKNYYEFKKDNLSAQNFEVIFEFLYFVLARAKLPFQIVLLICATITFASILYVITKYSSEPILSFFLVVALGILGNTFNAVRQYLALAVFLFSLKYIMNGNFVRYIICCIVAFLLHSSAIILFPLYFLRYFKMNYKTIILFVIIAIIGVFCLKPLTRLASTMTKINYYKRYFGSPEFYQPITLYYMLYAIGMICVFIFLYLIRNMVKKDQDLRIQFYDIFLILFLISALLRLFGTISGYFSLVNRFSIYFFFSIIFLIPFAIKSISKNIELRIATNLSVLGGGIVYCLISGVIRKSNGVYPYNFIWGNNQTYTIIFYSILAVIFVALIVLTIIEIKKLKVVDKNQPRKVIIARSTAIFNDSRTTKLMKELLNLGYDVTVLGWDRLGEFKENEIFESNGKVATVKLYQCKAEFGSGVKNIFKMLKFQCWLKKQIKALPENSIVHACDYDTADPIYEVLTRQKLIYDIFDFFSESRNMPKILKIFIKDREKYIVNNADATIICTEQRKKQIKWARPEKLVIIHNTPDLDLQSIKESSFKVKNNNRKLKVVYVGVLGDDRLIPEVAKECGKHKKFEFHFGGVGKYSKELKQYASKYSNLNYYGSLKYEDVLSLEKQCDILFATYNPNIPNHRYSAPNKFYEAGALSKPIIVCKNTGIDESVNKFNCGIAINYNTESFFEALEKYDSNRDIIKVQGENGKKCYDHNFSWEIMRKRIKSLYKDMSR